MGKKSKLPTLVKCSTSSASERGNKERELKDVACFVFDRQNDNSSIFLVDLAKGEIRSFLHLSVEDYPFAMSFAVHKCKLYMFGGLWMAADREDLPKEPADGSRPGITDAYVLDLVALAKAGGSDNDLKPLPKRITEMKAGKRFPEAVKVGNKICVFDTILGHKPPHCTFELFDPELKTWDTICDPFHLERGFFVDGYCVKDNKLFVSIRKNRGIFVLDFGASPSPVWHHHDLFHAVPTIPIMASKLEFGTLVLNFRKAYDLADEMAFINPISVHESGKTADDGYEVVTDGDGAILQIGHDRVCTVMIKRLRKPDCKGSSPIHKKPRTQKRVRKTSLQFVVNICGVNPSARPIELTVLQSFRFRTGYAEEESCFFHLASLCDA